MGETGIRNHEGYQANSSGIMAVNDVADGLISATATETEGSGIDKLRMEDGIKAF